MKNKEDIDAQSNYHDVENPHTVRAEQGVENLKLLAYLFINQHGNLTPTYPS